MKLLKQLLEDYLADPSDMRLEILVANVNPNFKLGKKNKDHIKLLIGDYSKNKDKTRLNILINFLGITKEPKEAKKSVGKSTSSAPVNTPVNTALTEIEKEYRQINEEILELSNQIRDAKGDRLILSALTPAYKALERKLEACIRKKEIENAKNLDPVKIEKEQILRIFGNPEDVNSMAYGILNGTKYEFQIKMNEDPAVMIKKLFSYNGKEPYEYSALLKNPVARIWIVRKGEHTVLDQGMEKLSNVGN